MSGPLDKDLWRAAALAAIGATTAALLLMTSDLIGFFFDDAIYALTAQAIADGHGFTYMHLPGHPPAIHYPPLWPLLLSLGFILGPEFPQNAGWLRLMNPVIIGGAAALATFYVIRVLGFRPRAALGVVLLGFISVQVQFLVNTILSEPFFLLWFFAALLLAERARTRGTATDWALLGVAVGCAVLTRTLGFALVLAVLSVAVLDRQWRGGAVFAAALGLTLLPWQLFVWRVAPGFPPEIAGSYGNYLSFVTRGYVEGGLTVVSEVVMKNLRDSWDFIGVPLQPFGGVPWRFPLGALAVLALLGGCIASLWRPAERVLALATLGYIAAVIVWPFHVERFYWGLWPAFIILVALGIRALLAWGGRLAPLPRRLAMGAAVTLGGVLAVGNIAYNVNGLNKGHVSLAPGVMTNRNLPMLRYINSREDFRDKVVSADVASMASLYSGLELIPTGDLRVTDHVRGANVQESANRLVAIDARYRPEVFVFLRGPGMARVMPLATFADGRTFVEVPSGDSAIQLFELEAP
ncbi:MAG: glycosyltransferase family 39 protein [Gemmatimonadaceae bacterium]|nr:glycosyltransferase family 39 protein [Gemmatimonadaceae bacterium]MCW5826693.1 glycosyltransferase family 39 protein [Gemmatimonadaceae bacterium]